MWAVDKIDLLKEDTRQKTEKFFRIRNSIAIRTFVQSTGESRYEE